MQITSVSKGKFREDMSRINAYLPETPRTDFSLFLYDRLARTVDFFTLTFFFRETAA